MHTKSLLPAFHVTRRPLRRPRWASLARWVGVFSALAVAGSKLMQWATSRRALPLALDLADLTEVASIPPPAPAPRHRPRVPSLSRPDVHAFEAPPVAPGSAHAP